MENKSKRSLHISKVNAQNLQVLKQNFNLASADDVISYLLVVEQRYGGSFREYVDQSTPTVQPTGDNQPIIT